VALPESFTAADEYHVRGGVEFGFLSATADAKVRGAVFSRTARGISPRQRRAHAHTRARTHARMRARTRAHTHARTHARARYAHASKSCSGCGAEFGFLSATADALVRCR
jgi:hypothetical protein